MMRSLIATIALVAAGFAAPMSARADVSYFRPVDPVLAEAVDKAQETLPVFLNHVFDRGGEGIRGSMIMIALGNPPNIEPIWVTPFFKVGEDMFEGHIEGLPQRLTGYMIGQKVPFGPDRVLDWSIQLDGGKTYGRYIDRARLDTMPEKQAAQLRDTLSTDPVPGDWQ